MTIHPTWFKRNARKAEELAAALRFLRGEKDGVAASLDNVAKMMRMRAAEGGVK